MKSYLNNHSIRGIRNNNPGNIERSSSAWKGKIPYSQSKDSRFEQFTHIEYGIRALFILMKNYRKKYGLDTPAKIINRYAPSHENPTNAYATYIAQRLGISVNDSIPNNESTQKKLVRAIIEFECGVSPSFISDEVLNRAYLLYTGGNSTPEEVLTSITNPEAASPTAEKIGNLITMILVIVLTTLAYKSYN